MSVRYLGRPSVIQPWCQSKCSVARARWATTTTRASPKGTAAKNKSEVPNERISRLMELGHLRRASASQLLRYAATGAVDPMGSESHDKVLNDILDWRFSQPNLFDSVHRRSPFTVEYFHNRNRITTDFREAGTLCQIQANLERSLASHHLQHQNKALSLLGDALKRLYKPEQAKEVLATINAVIAKLDSTRRSDTVQPLLVLGMQLSCVAFFAPALSNFLGLYFVRDFGRLPISTSHGLIEQLTSSLEQRCSEDATIDLEPLRQVVTGVDRHGATVYEKKSLMSMIDWDGSGDTDQLIIASTKLYCLLDCKVGLQDLVLHVRRRLMSTTSIRSSSAQMAQAVDVLLEHKKYNVAVELSKQLLYFTKLEDVLSLKTLSKLLLHDDKMALRKTLNEDVMRRILTEELEAIESSLDIVWSGGEEGRHVAMQDSELWEAASDFVDEMIDHGNKGQSPLERTERSQMKQFLKGPRKLKDAREDVYVAQDV